ncbi:unnamed protein product [Pleuronectes platessa]|uniref:Uncharacterized protein n=1 Tax=Pleuronectes platessa TaxID=8262 RepID=A0A9N7UG45_PLEPL|nr:unnamed protein product [Pleuronectes platessa]
MYYLSGGQLCECGGVREKQGLCWRSLSSSFSYSFSRLRRPVTLCMVTPAVSLSKAVMSLLFSPLSLYSWLSSTLIRLLLSVPVPEHSAAAPCLVLVLCLPLHLSAADVSPPCTCFTWPWWFGLGPF